MNNNSPTVQKSNNNVSARGQIYAQAEIFSGPLPPPQILSEYERIVPGSAAKIIEMAVSQSEHRKSLEAKVIGSNVLNSKLGLWFGLIIGLAGISGSVVLGVFGRQWSSGFLGAGTLVSLVSVFVYGSQQRKKERAGREKELNRS